MEFSSQYGAKLQIIWNSSMFCVHVNGLSTSRLLHSHQHEKIDARFELVDVM